METLVDEMRTARNPHRCMLCYRAIDIGERYRYQRNTESREIWTWRNCGHCDRLMDILCRIGYDSDWGVTADEVGQWEPETIAEMRLKVYWKLGWRRRDGSLYPYPETARAA